MVAAAAWCAARHWLHLGNAIVRALINSALSACVSRPASPTCSDYARNSNGGARSSRTRSMSAPGAVNVSSASGAARSAISIAGLSDWAVTAPNATRHSCWSISSERRWFRLTELSTAAREWAWTCRSARAELGQPLRGSPHAHPRATTPGDARCFSGYTDPQIKSRTWTNGRGDRLA